MQFFFTAPVSRRALLNYKLLRPQLGMLFGVAIASLFSGAASASGFGRWAFVAGRVAAVCRHRPARARGEPHEGELQGAGSEGALAGVGIGGGDDAGVGRGARVAGRPCAALVSRPTGEALRAVLEASRSGSRRWRSGRSPPSWRRCWPRMPAAFARALVPALAIAAVNYWWVLASDARLVRSVAAAEEAEVKERRGVPKPVVRAAPFTLVPAGRLETAVFWKNTIQFGRYASVAVLVRVLLPIVILAVIVGLNRKGGSFAPIVLMLALFATLIGPYMVRNDLRMDLPRLPVLKTWPITGRELLVGELLAPWAVLSIVVWFLLALAFALSPAWSAGPGDSVGRAAVAAGRRDPRADADRGAVDRAERGRRAVSGLGGDGRRARARRRGDGAEHPDVRRDAPVAGDRRAARAGGGGRSRVAPLPVRSAGPACCPPPSSSRESCSARRCWR